MYLKDKKGKSNDKGQLRATVAGEIAYEEIKSRAKKGETKELDISSLNNAVMDKNSVVSADRYFNKTRGEIEKEIETVKYFNNIAQNEEERLKTVGKDEEFDKKNLEYKAEYEKKIGAIEEIVKISELEEQYRIIEIPRLENQLSVMKYGSEKEALKSRLNLLKDERDTLEGFLRNNKIIGQNLFKGAAEGGIKGTIKGVAYGTATKIAKGASSTLLFLTSSEELNSNEDKLLSMYKPVSKEEAKYISENFPEYYNAYNIKDRIKEVVSWNKDERNNSIINFYKNSKGELAKDVGNSLGEVAGFTVGGAISTKFVNMTNSQIKDSKLSIKPNDKTIDTTRVGRWMSEAEYNKMLETGKVQVSDGGITHVANPADINAFRSAKKGSIYVEFDVKTKVISPGGNENWGIISGPNSTYDKLNRRKGLPGIEKMPDAFNIEMKGKK